MKRLRKFPYVLLAILLSMLLCSCASIPQSQQSSDTLFVCTLPFIETTAQITEISTTDYVDPSSEATQPVTTATTKTTEPPHIHSFSDASCISPKACECGVTEGTVTEHSWINATCSNPKTCEICGITSGSSTKHIYSGGYCKFCGDTDPDYFENNGDMVWIPTKGGKKYHARSGCSNMIDPDYVSKSEAASRGFTPCKKCY